ncbi:MAG: hypothetical protein H6906_13530 [Hyphomicrobiales bacterium]|nr:hypothetical protein [Hyphomicrobiales bacterium]
MDAVAEAEWRMLPLLNLLDDATARAVFIAAHVPLVALLLGLVGHRRAAVRLWSRAAVDAFLVIHAGLHWALSADPLYTFHAPLSEALIFGGALLGLAHLAVLARRVPLARKGV